MNKTFNLAKRIIASGVCFALLMLSHLGFSQTTTTNYTTSGTVVFGAGVTTVNVSLWGGGGGGSAGGGIEYSGTFNQVETYYTGAGGGGSNWTGGNVAVVPGTSYNFVVGTGGIAGGIDGSNNPLPGGNGGASSFLGVVSPGGYGGAAFPDSLGGPRADAPTPDPGNPYAASGENNGRVYGGDGGLSNSGTYGASGYDADGFSGWGYNRGALGYQTGVPGLKPGDGGGGGGYTVFPIIFTLAEKIAGGKGGNGRVEFRYNCNYQLTTAPLATNICGSGSSTVTLGSSSMPSGDYVVTYSTSNPSTTGNTANMTFDGSADIGAFTTISLSLSSIITVTNLASGTTCSNSVGANNSVTAIVENSTLILTGELGANSFCTEDQISVPFSTGCFDFHPTGNTFTAQLSAANGSFASPTTIGTLAGSSSGTISATLPANTPAGANYRIRVVGDNPATVGSDNGADIGVRITTINTVVASASDVSICQGESIDLSVSNSSVEVADSSIILAGDFETAMNDWMFIDNSSYEYTGAVNATPDNLWINLDGNGIESNDASSYYAVNSTGRFGADVTNAVLQSPVFSTIGYNEVSLSFFHTYAWGNFNNQDSIRVQISEDNGSSWTNVYLNNSSNVGFLTAFSEQVIDLDAYANKGALMLRFNYAALGALGRWYVDNITVKGVSIPNTYEWTSSPAGFTSSIQNPTGLEPTETTTYSVTNDNNYGCSANVSTIEVVVSDTSSSSTVLSVCPSELPYSWNSLTFSAAGSQTATFTNAAGCDSLATLNLTIKAVSSSSSAESICPSGLPYSWNGLTFTEGGTQIANLTNSVGCDSAATMVLTVKPATSSITNQNICGSELPYIWNGITFTNAGTESASFINSVGCDSTATLNLSLIPSTSVTASATLATICPSGTIDLSAVSTAGNTTLIINEGFNASGNGWTTFNTSTGGVPENADWSLQPHLYSPSWAGGFEFMSNDNSQFYISSSVAQGDEVTTSTILESPSFSTEGLASASLSFFHQFKHQPGIIGNPNDSIRVQISTDGSTWTNIYFNNSSSVGLSPEDFVEQIISLNGYLNESDVKLRFEYNGTPFNTPGWTGFNLWWAIDNVVVSGILDADTYTWSSNPAGFTSSTQNPTGLSPAVTTTYTVSTENGFCSSSDDVTVSVVAASQPSTTNLTICDSELPYTWNGLTFTEADTQTANFTVAGACDSAATLVLSVNLGTSSSTNITICPAGLPYTWNGLTFTEAGTQTASLTNSLSCDSAATLILAVELTNSTSTTNVTICETELPYSWNGQTLNEAGNLTANFTNSLGCDSIATLNLVVNTSPQNVFANASETGVCPDGTVDLSASADNNTVTLLSEDFNSVSDYWSTTNNSTGGVFADAAWTKRPDGYEMLGGAITYHSNDNSQFYHTSSFAQGAGGTTNTILQSPTFSTVGISAASLTFYQEYGNRDANDAISVEISTDGTSWTSAYLNSSDLGSSSSFVQTTVSLNGYLNQPYVMIRFVYTAANDFMWAIDNVSITGTPVAHAYSWSSNPIGFTSSTQNPTGLNLTETTTYAVTITNGRGCADSTDVEVVFLPSSTSTSNETVCLSELPYAWNGLTFAAAGSQTATLTNALGCDSLATLELAVSSPNNSSTIATICTDELPYTWSGMTFNASASESLSFTDVNGCDSTAALTLTVNPIPTGVLASASDSSIVSGASIDLSSTSTVPNGNIMDENFNAATNDWTTINLGSGGTVAAASWTLRPDGYYSTESNDNSQFYFSSSIDQGPGLTNTILQSPVFSTEGYSSISLSFYHAFVDNNTQDSVRAQVSINNGTTWTTVYLRAIGDAGVYNSFLQTTVSLDAFLGQSNVMVRFNYRANYGYYWAIDNVSVTGTALSNDYSWTSVPVGYTSAAQNPSGISPSETTIYSVTATNTFGCTATDDVTVNVHPTYNLTETVSVCNGNSYTFPDGSMQSNITSQVVYTSNLQTVELNDSIIETTVNVLPVYSLTDTVDICSDDSYTFPDGSTQTGITSEVVYSSTLTTVSGCDSIIETTVVPHNCSCDNPTVFLVNSLEYYRVTISWNPIYSALEYKVRFRAVGAGSWQYITVTASDTFKTKAGLVQLTDYEWQVKTVCDGEQSGYGALQSFTTPAMPCDPPTTYSTTGILDERATMNWSEVSTFLEYKIRIREVGVGSWTFITETNTSKTRAGLTPGTDYQWQVKVVCAGVQSSYGPLQYFTTYLVSPCPNPDTYSTTLIQGDRATLGWSAVGPATTYKVRFREVGSPSWTNIYVNASNTSKVKAGLASETDYEWQLRTKCADVQTAYGPMQYFTTGPDCPNPTGFSVTNILEDRATMNWVEVTDAVEYKVKIRVVGGSWSYLTASAPDIHKTKTGLDPATDYQWRVRSVCASSRSPFAAVQVFTTLPEPEARLSNIQDEETGDIKAYPNPTSGKLIIDFGEDYENASVVIRNTLGQIVHSVQVEDTDQLMVNVPGATGLYTIEVLTEEGKSDLFRVMKK